MGNEGVSDLTSRYKVIVIGGGIAGVTAANSFMKQNLSDFLLLEASNRLGGRIASVVAGCDLNFILIIAGEYKNAFNYFQSLQM